MVRFLVVTNSSHTSMRKYKCLDLTLIKIFSRLEKARKCLRELSLFPKWFIRIDRKWVRVGLWPWEPRPFYCAMSRHEYGNESIYCYANNSTVQR